MGRYNLINAELVSWLNDQPDEPRFHAAFGDPPYYLGSIAKRFGGKNAAPAQFGQDGAFSRLSKGFMGETWDGFDSPKAFQDFCYAWGTGLYKTLYPGAIAAFAGASRTSHRLAVGLEDAGFEFFDTIQWIYGSGWPKGRNLSLAIDSAAGVRPLKRQRKKLDGSAANSTKGNQSVAHGDYGNKNLAYDDPITEDARRWKGYNTVLRPSYEPIMLFRKPRQGRVADDALQFGTGALNIGGAGIPVQGDSRTRYPGNVILFHSEACRFLGYIKIKNEAGDKQESDGGEGGVYREYENRPAFDAFGDADGIETVEQWECSPDCPVCQINQQSGESTSGGGQTRTAARHLDYHYGEMPRQLFGDTGGASRFFYSGKAASWERCAGLPARCEHPTMKPIQLTEYISRLLLMPPFPDGQPRRILIPFSGVGSEMIGAALAGWDEVTGIERGEDYCQDAERRLAWWIPRRTYAKAKRAYNHLNKLAKAANQPDQQTKQEGDSKSQMKLF